MAPALRILAGLVLGLGAGGLIAWQDRDSPALVGAAEVVGGLWLHALQMTVLPLIVALIISGVASVVAASRGGRVAAQAIGLFVILLVGAASLGAVLANVLLRAWPLGASAAQSLRSGLAGMASGIPPQPMPRDMVLGIIPANPFAAAAGGEVLPLVVFALALGFAISSLAQSQRQLLIGVFEALRSALLHIVGWVLWIAPVGVFALGFKLAAGSDIRIAGAVIHYVAIVCLVGSSATVLAYGMAWASGLSPNEFARAAAPAQTVAISTQSSLASLPAMLEGAAELGVPGGISGVSLPLAVSMFRFTSPLMNMAVTVYAAHLFGIEPGLGQYAVAVLIAVLANFSVVGVASQATFFVGLVPVFAALRVPPEILAIVIAVETVPDIVRTLGNVSMDLAVTSLIHRAVERDFST